MHEIGAIAPISIGWTPWSQFSLSGGLNNPPVVTLLPSSPSISFSLLYLSLFILLSCRRAETWRPQQPFEGFHGLSMAIANISADLPLPPFLLLSLYLFLSISPSPLLLFLCWFRLGMVRCRAVSTYTTGWLTGVLIPSWQTLLWIKIGNNSYVTFRPFQFCLFIDSLKLVAVLQFSSEYIKFMKQVNNIFSDTNFWNQTWIEDLSKEIFMSFLWTSFQGSHKFLNIHC